MHKPSRRASHETHIDDLPRRVHENEIRDALAARLDLIEPGLQLVATEYRLPARRGAGGRVDILARDATGCFVVVELKRTAAAAELALHELHKYVELFRREKGLGSADLRVVLVAVEWHGLHAAFSQAAREWPAGLRGYRLLLAEDDVTPIAAERVDPLPEAPARSLTPIQLLIQPRSGNLEGAWRWAIDNLKDFGAKHVVGFDVAHPVFDNGVYIVIGRMLPSKASFHTEPSNEPDELGTELWVDMSDAPAGYEAEYRALAQLCQTFNSFTLELCHPGSLASLRSDPDWTIEAVRRTGVYADTALYPDRELIMEASTGGGLSDVKFTGTARADHPPRWSRFLQRMEFALQGNSTWETNVPDWCRQLTELDSAADLLIHIFNPCDLIAAVAFGWPGRFSEYVPMVLGHARLPAHGAYLLKGELVWSGYGIDVLAAFESVYQDATGWILARSHGLAWESDEELLALLGLGYGLFERYEHEPRFHTIAMQDDILSHPLAESKPLDMWIQRQRHALWALATRLRYELGIPEPHGDG